MNGYSLPIGPVVLVVTAYRGPLRGWRFGVVVGGDEGIDVHVDVMSWEFSFEVLRRNP